MLTAEQLQSIMPGLSAKRNAEFLPFLQAALTEFGIEGPARAAAFLAQLAHESGQFRFMEEIWGPTPAQRRYEPPSSLATTLGNTEAGDGKRFKGRGPIQITGRANYRRFGDLLNVELMSDPARAAVPDLAFRIAGLYWSKKGLNELADRATADAFREITRRINGGFNGLEDRKQFYASACTVLGVEAPLTRGAERDLPVPDEAEEPAFDRGHEAIRRHVPGRRPRKAASAKRKAAPVARKSKTGRASAEARRATTGSRKAKTGSRKAKAGARKAKTSARKKTRKVASAPRGTSSQSRVSTTAKRSAAARARKTGSARRNKARSAAKK